MIFVFFMAEYFRIVDNILIYIQQHFYMNYKYLISYAGLSNITKQ